MADAPLNAKPHIFQNTWTEVGWADVHHPCGGHIKAYLRVVLPDVYRGKLQGEVAKFAVLKILTWVGIPSDETYEAHFHFGGGGIGLVQPVDRQGMTDRSIS